MTLPKTRPFDLNLELARLKRPYLHPLPPQQEARDLPQRRQHGDSEQGRAQEPSVRHGLQSGGGGACGHEQEEQGRVEACRGANQRRGEGHRRLEFRQLLLDFQRAHAHLEAALLHVPQHRVHLLHSPRLLHHRCHVFGPPPELFAPRQHRAFQGVAVFQVRHLTQVRLCQSRHVVVRVQPFPNAVQSGKRAEHERESGGKHKRLGLPDHKQLRPDLGPARFPHSGLLLRAQLVLPLGVFGVQRLGELF
mmetsp:Transcript_21840/g.36918  ORF Transcript_21840/g.36918 Transcript_21840/m.36918 type:complete len:249 (+) Transcript_21840:227-973(+)